MWEAGSVSPVLINRGKFDMSLEISLGGRVDIAAVICLILFLELI